MKLRSLLLATSFLALAAPAFAQTVSESPNPVAPGAALSVTYSDPGAQPNDNIWIQDANGNQLEVVSLNGSTSGTITSFTAPATPGDYRIYGGFHGTAAGPAEFTVSSSPPPSTASIDLSDGSHLAPSTNGDVVGVSSGAFTLVAPQAGPKGDPGTNAGQQGLFTPSSSTMACSQGQSGFDASYLYLCTAANTWVRTAITPVGGW